MEKIKTPYPQRVVVKVNDDEKTVQVKLKINDEKGNLLVETEPVNSEEVITLNYEGLVFVSYPNCPVYLEFSSLLNKMNEYEHDNKKETGS